MFLFMILTTCSQVCCFNGIIKSVEFRTGYGVILYLANKLALAFSVFLWRLIGLSLPRDQVTVMGGSNFW